MSPQFVAMGIDCLKIEGRTKSHYYAARTTRVYRQAIDDAVAGRRSRRSCSMNSTASPTGATPRASTGAMRRRICRTTPMAHHAIEARIFVGEVLGLDTDTGLVAVAVKNRFRRWVACPAAAALA
jgi:putative protease